MLCLRVQRAEKELFIFNCQYNKANCVLMCNKNKIITGMVS